MLPSLDVEIRGRLAHYLAEEMPLSEFWDWVMPRTCNLSQEVDQNAAALAYDVQLLLFEFCDGLWTEPELRDKLRLLARDYHATLASSSSTESPAIQTGSSATTSVLTGWAAGLRSVAGAPPSTASGDENISKEHIEPL